MYVRYFLVPFVVFLLSCTATAPPPEIISFRVQNSWGDAPFATELSWEIKTRNGASVSCEIDVQGDGLPDLTVRDCQVTQTLPHIFKEPGRHTAVLRAVTADGGSAEARVDVYANHVEYTEAVLQLDQLPGLLDVSLSAEQVVLTFASDGSRPALHEGSILLSGKDGGFLRKVTKVVEEGKDSLLLTTVEATIEETVKRCFFAAQDPPMNPMSASATAKETPVYMVTEDGRRLLISSQQRSLHYEVSGQKIQAKFSFPEPKLVADDGTIVARFPKIELTVEFGLNRFLLDTSGISLRELLVDLSYSAKVAISAQLAPTKNLFKPIRFEFGEIPLFTLPYAVPITFTTTMMVSLKGQLDLSIGAEATVGVAGGMKLSYADGKLARTGSFSPSLSTRLTAETAVKLNVLRAVVGVGPVIGTKIWTIKGPYIRPYVTFEANGSVDWNLTKKTLELCVDGDYGLNGDYGISTKLFGYQLESVGTFQVLGAPLFKTPQCITVLSKPACTAGTTCCTDGGTYTPVETPGVGCTNECQACDGQGRCSASSSGTQCTNGQCNNGVCAARPAVVQNLQATPSIERVSLQWDPQPAATSYHLYFSTAPGVTVANAMKIAGVTPPYLHSGLTGGRRYYYRVSGVNANGEGVLSAEVSAIPNSAQSVPTAPSGLAVTFDGTVGANNLVWGLSSGATSYQVYWAQAPGVSMASSKLPAITMASQRHTGVNTGARYYYRVSASNATGESALSAEVSVDIPLASCSGSASQTCGRCGAETRTCNNGTWSSWGACSGEGPCSPGQMQACGSGGSQTCSAACAWGTCDNQTCVGSSSQVCGRCGTQARTCSNGTWSSWGACGGEGPCSPGQTQSCGSGGTQICSATCAWGTCDNQTCVGSSSQACGRCGAQTRACSNGTWSNWGACGGEGPCSPGQTQSCGSGGTQICSATCAWGTCDNQTCVGSSSQACGRCGAQTRACSNGTWSNWGACGGEGPCSPGQTQSCGSGGTQICSATCAWGTCDNQTCVGSSSQACGRCGAQTRTCNNGTWSSWSACGGEGPCSPGQTQSCGSGGTQTCSAVCAWGVCACTAACPSGTTCDGQGRCVAASPSVQASPNGGAQGVVITESGCGFTPGGTAELRFSSAAGSTTQTKTVDAQGCFSHTYSTGDGTPPGLTTYYAVDLVTGLRSSNTVTFNITCSMAIMRYWKQYAGNDTDHQFVSSLNPAPSGWTVDRGGRPVFFLCRFPVAGTLALYEQYQSTTHDHIYTSDATERANAVNQGFTAGTIIGYLSPSAGPLPSTTPLFRLKSSLHSDHLYTIDRNEADSAVATGGYSWDPSVGAAGGQVWP